MPPITAGELASIPNGSKIPGGMTLKLQWLTGLTNLVTEHFWLSSLCRLRLTVLFSFTSNVKYFPLSHPCTIRYACIALVSCTGSPLHMGSFLGASSLTSTTHSIVAPIMNTLHVCDGCVAWSIWGTHGNGAGVSLVLLLALGNLFLILDCLTQPATGVGDWF